MRGEDELDAQDRRLSSVQDGFRDNQRKIERVLEDYASLLEDYRLVKSDLEEERSNRERYKRMARGQERNPFILMLVDGNEYIFSDALIQAESDGGREAAVVLENTVRQSLPPSEREMQLVVRVFADVSSISKALSRSGLVKQHSRSLADFTAAFSGAKEHFDFIDAGAGDATRRKMRENLRLLADNTQCKRVIFAGCHELRYLDALSTFRKRSDKLLLIKSVNWAPPFEKLGSPILRYARVFREAPLPVHPPPTQRPSARPSAPPSYAQTAERSPSYAMRAARSPSPWGGGSDRTATRRIRHHNRRNQEDEIERNDELSERNLRRRDEMQARPEESFRAFELTRPVDNFGNARPVNRSESPDDLRLNVHARQLPNPRPGAERMIPLNADGERIDTLLDRPAPLDWERFKRKATATKVCNDYHLNDDGCTRPNCPFNHRPITEEERLILRHLARELPCPRKGACRWGDCYHGHVCVRDACAGYGKGCRLKKCMHGISLTVMEWVEPVPYVPKRADSRAMSRVEDTQSPRGIEAARPFHESSAPRHARQSKPESEFSFEGPRRSEIQLHRGSEVALATSEEHNFSSHVSNNEAEMERFTSAAPSHPMGHESVDMDDVQSEKLISDFSPEQSLRQPSPPGLPRKPEQKHVASDHPEEPVGQLAAAKESSQTASKDDEPVPSVKGEIAAVQGSIHGSERRSVSLGTKSGSIKHAPRNHSDLEAGENGSKSASQSKAAVSRHQEEQTPAPSSRLSVPEPAKPVQAKSRSEPDFDSDHHSIPASENHKAGRQPGRSETPIMTAADIWGPETTREEQIEEEEELGIEQRELLNISDSDFAESYPQDHRNNTTNQFQHNQPRKASQPSFPETHQSQPTQSIMTGQQRSNDARNFKSQGWGDRADGAAFNAGWTDNTAASDWNDPMPNFSQQQQQPQRSQNSWQPQQQAPQHQYQQQQQKRQVNPPRPSHSHKISNGGWEIGSNDGGDGYDEGSYENNGGNNYNNTAAWGGKGYQQPYHSGRELYRNEYRSVPGSEGMGYDGARGGRGGRGRGQRGGGNNGPRIY